MTSVHLLHAGYIGTHTASTVVLVRDGDALIVVDPGMVARRSLILDPLAALGVAPEAVTHVALSHHHPDHTMNVALFPEAEVVDFWARYRDDLWLDHDGDGYHLAPHTQLWLTPGHSEEDITLVVEADDAVYAMTHLWWGADRTPEIDPFASDQAAQSEAARGSSRPPTSSFPGTAGPSAPASDGTGPGTPASGPRSADHDHPPEIHPMSDRSPRRLAAIWFAAVLTLILAGCAGVATPPGSQAPGSQAPAAPSAPVPSADPGAAIDVDGLLAAAAAKDGQVVRVTGNFLADETSAQLCALLMESYPPQCGGGVRLTGTVPADTLDALTTTREPDLKKMWWGYVTVTGTFHASGGDGRPTLEIGEIELVEG